MNTTASNLLPATTTLRVENGLAVVPKPNAPAKKKKPSRRDLITSATIRCLVARQFLLKPEGPYTARADYERAQRHHRDHLAAAQLDLEKLMVRFYHLDHLDSVDLVYGIKRRVPKSLVKPPVAPAAA